MRDIGCILAGLTDLLGPAAMLLLWHRPRRPRHFPDEPLVNG